MSILCARWEETCGKILWDYVIRWDRAAGMSLAPIFPSFASWWCSLFTKQLYTRAFYHPHQAGTEGLGWRRFPCNGHKSSTSSLTSTAHSSSPDLIYLVLVAASQTRSSSSNHLSTPSPVSLTVYSSLDFASAALMPYFPRCCGCQQQSRGCKTGFMPHVLGVTSLIETGTDLGLKLSWAGFDLGVSQASLPQ